MATVTADHLAGLSIQEVARRTGFTEPTLRYYERADTRTENPGMFGAGIADYALEPRYAELLWKVSAEMVATGKYSRHT